MLLAYAILENPAFAAFLCDAFFKREVAELEPGVLFQENCEEHSAKSRKAINIISISWFSKYLNIFKCLVDF